MKKSIIVVIVFFFSACHSYQKLKKKISELRLDYNSGNYTKALTSINHNDFYTNKHNKVLLNLELGKAFHLQQKYDSSNYYFNQADLLMEDKLKLADYKGDDIDKIMIHYYMTLNYLYLNKNDDALVEAKRIDLRVKAMSDKNSTKNKIDPFAQILQGIIYERLNNYDDAFIAYRDAYEVYEKQGLTNHLAVNMPSQLVSDLINSAHKANNISNRDFYCQKFNVKFESIKDTSKNKLVFFWENGITPIKKQQCIDFRLIREKNGNVLLVDKNKNITLPIVISPENKVEFSLSNIKMIRVSYAVIVESKNVYTDLSLPFLSKIELVENVANSKQVNTLTYNELDRYVNVNFAKELVNGKNERVNAKKTAEDALVKKKKEVADVRKKAEQDFSEVKSEDERATKLKEMEVAQKKADQEIAKLKQQIASPSIKFNSSTLNYTYSYTGETRCWQSLPAQIFYTKISISKKDNPFIITLKTIDGTVIKDTLAINTERRLNVVNYTTLKHLSCDANAFVPLNP